MITSQVTKRGQTTLPRQVQDALQIEPGRKLVYEIKKDSVVIRQHPGVMASFGALKGLGKSTGLDLEAVRALEKDAWAAHAAQEGLPK